MPNQFAPLRTVEQITLAQIGIHLTHDRKLRLMCNSQTLIGAAFGHSSLNQTANQLWSNFCKFRWNDCFIKSSPEGTSDQ